MVQTLEVAGRGRHQQEVRKGVGAIAEEVSAGVEVAGSRQVEQCLETAGRSIHQQVVVVPAVEVPVVESGVEAAVHCTQTEGKP